MGGSVDQACRRISKLPSKMDTVQPTLRDKTRFAITSDKTEVIATPHAIVTYHEDVNKPKVIHRNGESTYPQPFRFLWVVFKHTRMEPAIVLSTTTVTAKRPWQMC